MTVIRKVRAATCVVLALALACTGQALQPASGQTAGPNLLDNPDFGWPEQTNPDVCAPEWIKHSARTPRAWVPYWACKTESQRNQDQINREPEFRAMNADIEEQRGRVRSYPTAASFFNFYSLNQSAGLVQVVRNITPGSRLRFSIWTQLWTTNGDSPNSDFQPGGLQARACIDTSGVTTARPDFNNNAIVCGAPTRTYDQYVQISVEAVAAANQVTVIFDTSAEYPVKHNDVFADDAELIVVGGAAAAPAAPAAPAASAAAGPAVSIKLAQANIRNAPSYAGAIIGTGTLGTSYPATAVTQDGQWFQIQYQGGVAYVHASVVTPNSAAQAALNGGRPAAPPAAPTATPVATSPSPPSGAPAPATSGNALDALPIVQGLPTKPAAPAPAPATPSGEAQAIANTGRNRLIVRAQPVATGTVLGRVVTGTAFRVLGVSADKKFWRVVYPGAPGGEGWVMVQWTSANEAAQRLLQ